MTIPATLSVRPATTTTVKHRNQDDRAKISEMYVTLKRTVHMLIQMCENCLKTTEEATASSASSLAKKDETPKPGKRHDSKENAVESKSKPMASGSSEGDGANRDNKSEK